MELLSSQTDGRVPADILLRYVWNVLTMSLPEAWIEFPTTTYLPTMPQVICPTSPWSHKTPRRGRGGCQPCDSYLPSKLTLSYLPYTAVVPIQAPLLMGNTSFSLYDIKRYDSIKLLYSVLAPALVISTVENQAWVPLGGGGESKVTPSFSKPNRST